MIVRDIIFAVIMVGVMISGFFLMGHLDKFLDENRKRVKKEKREGCVRLSADLSDEELIKRIRTYDSGRGDAKILLYREAERDGHDLFENK